MAATTTTGPFRNGGPFYLPLDFALPDAYTEGVQQNKFALLLIQELFLQEVMVKLSQPYSRVSSPRVRVGDFSPSRSQANDPVDFHSSRRTVLVRTHAMLCFVSFCVVVLSCLVLSCLLLFCSPCVVAGVRLWHVYLRALSASLRQSSEQRCSPSVMLSSRSALVVSAFYIVLYTLDTAIL